MAIAELPPRRAAPPPRLDRSVDAAVERLERRGPTLEQLAYLALFVLALLTHLYLLGDGALHHDETHHANYSWRLFAGLGFIHDPLLHGPFLYHIGALLFFIFGDNNTTARLGPALFGSALVVLPFLIRRELGRGASLLASLYLLISPAYMYWSRHIRHDMYQVTFEMLAFIAIVRYASTRRPLWLYIGAAALGCMFTNMETFFLYVAMFLPLVALAFLWRVWRPGILVAAGLGLAIVAAVFVLPGKPPVGGSVQRANGGYVCPSPGNLFPPANPIQADPGPIFGFEPLPTADNDYAMCVRVQPDDNFVAYLAKLSQFFGHPAILLGLVITLGGLIAVYVLVWRRRGPDGATAWQRARAANDGVLDAFASLALGRRALIALAIFLSIYGMLFSSFLIHPTGLISGTTGSLLYWLAQHGVARGSQPGYYYLIIMILYEPLVLLWSVIGLVMTGFLVGQRLLGGENKEQKVRTENQEPRTAEPTTDDRQPTTDDEALYGGPSVAALLTTDDGRRTTDHGPETSDDRPERSDNSKLNTQHSKLASRAIDWPFVMPLMLVWWGIGTLGLYSWAGEKMPWLIIHVALPPVLLGAWAFARTLAWWRAALPEPSWRFARPATQNGTGDAADHSVNGHGEQVDPPATQSNWAALGIYLAIFFTIALFCFQSITLLSKPDDPLQWRLPFVLLGGLAFVLILSAGAALLRGVRWMTGALAIALTLLLLVYGAYSSYRLSFLWPDVAREKMIFVQTSTDAGQVIARLEQASIRRGGGLDLPIWYDNETIWAWYLRRFTDKQQAAQQITTPPGPEIQAVLMLQENIDANPQNLQNLNGFRIQRYPLRWWFPNEGNRLPDDWLTRPLPEDGQPPEDWPLLMRLLRTPFDGRSQAQLWRYLIYRIPPEPLGSTDFVIAVRPELADEIGLGTGGDQP